MHDERGRRWRPYAESRSFKDRGVCCARGRIGGGGGGEEKEEEARGEGREGKHALIISVGVYIYTSVRSEE